MRFDLITLFPELIDAAMQLGVVGRARKRAQILSTCHNPRDFAYDAYRTVDERPFGGGPGMVMQIAPIKAALAAARAADPRPVSVLYLSPQGRMFTQAHARTLARRERLILICGRYEGLDERLLQNCVDEELSIGDYVLSGGELAALVVIDAVTRLLPGVLNTSASADQDSFENGLLDCPHYTRPEQAAEGEVPSVLLSGDHQAIARWRRTQSLGRTWLRRPDLLARVQLSKQDRDLLSAFQRQHMGSRSGSD